jgi:hypothetical protein
MVTGTVTQPKKKEPSGERILQRFGKLFNGMTGSQLRTGRCAHSALVVFS